jgi:hypothetical protein
MRFPLAHIYKRAAHRPAGYVEDVLGRGKVDGEWFEIDEAAYRALLAKYRRAEGLGDTIAWLLDVSGVAWLAGRWSKTCHCAARQAWMNALFPYSWVAWQARCKRVANWAWRG